MTTTTARRITLTVHGFPQPKGSMKAFRAWRSSRLVVTSDNPKVKGWQLAITAAAVQSRGRAQAFDGPVSVTCTFALPRPESYPKRVIHHVTKPDVDKLARAVLDALTAAKVLADDGRVSDLVATKRYGTEAGAYIAVSTGELDLAAIVKHARATEALELYAA